MGKSLFRLVVRCSGLLVIGCCFLLNLVLSDTIYAVINISGGQTSGGYADCNFLHGFQDICYYGNNVYEGGATWRVYKFGSQTQPRTDWWNSGEILGSDTPTIESIEADCNNKKIKSGWYVAYGWDGRNSGPGSGFAHWGPAAWGLGTIGGSATQYNDLDGKGLSYDEFVEKAENNTLRSGEKLNKGVAEQIYGGTIPARDGAFCVPEKFVSTVFKGMSRVWEGSGNFNDVSNAKKNSTGYVQTDKTVVQVMSKCGSSGCTATLAHYLQRESGSSSTQYRITRMTNKSGVGNISSNSMTTEKFAKNNIEEKKETFYNLMPGEYVCETLRFYIDGKSKERRTIACAYATGSSGSGIDIKVMNTALSSMAWSDSYVYAKPGDEIALKGSYTPSSQSAYGMSSTWTEISGMGTYVNGASTIGGVFNWYVYPNWNNAFSVSLNGKAGPWNKQGIVGDTSQYENVVNKAYTIARSDVGSGITATASTNTSGIGTTPRQVSFTYIEAEDEGDEEGFKATVNKNAISDTAEVRVPYNYVNATEITTPEDTIFFAGESIVIGFDLVTGTRWNDYTEGDYATIVRDGRWKIEACYNGKCVETNEKKGTLNSEGRMEGDTKSTGINISIPDVSAGTEICLRSAVWPANSGGFGNYTNASGSGTWQYSSRKYCYIIAKRPSFQIWGGNIYSQGDIVTVPSEKTNVDGYAGYDINRVSKHYIFGSWGELGVIATGEVKRLASGAGTGYKDGLMGVNYMATGNGPGGSEEGAVDYCKRTTLSFANNKCNSGFTGLIGEKSSMNSAEQDKISIIENFISEGAANTSGAVSLTALDESKRLNNGVYRYNGGSSKIEIVESQVGAGQIIVVYTKGDLIISGNIARGYESYDSLGSVPRVILYGNNIKIRCGVQRVDALIVAENSVNTCVNSENVTPEINDGLRSNQLTINGAVIADKVEFNRTFGSATGYNSITPAELVNFDSTLYMWGVRSASITKSGKISTVMLKELSPRY